jgi:hypothetical protein
MFKKLRIICCIVAALILAACVFIFVYLGMIYGLLSLLVAAVFVGLMFLFKSKQEEQENKGVPPTHGDFITGSVRQNNDDGKVTNHDGTPTDNKKNVK